MCNVRILLLLILSFVLWSSSTNAYTTLGKKKKSDIRKEKQEAEPTYIEFKKNQILVNYQGSAILGAYGSMISKYDDSPTARVIHGTSISYQRFLSENNAIGFNLSFVSNTISSVQTNAKSYSASYAYYISELVKVRTYFQIELGQIKAETDDLNSASSESDYVTFYKLGVGTNSDIRDKLLINVELFYRNILSKDSELINVRFTSVEENLVSIGLMIGIGYKW